MRCTRFPVRGAEAEDDREAIFTQAGMLLEGEALLRKANEILPPNFKPVSAAPPFEVYQEMPGRFGDADDIAWLKKARQPPSFRKLGDVLADPGIQGRCMKLYKPGTALGTMSLLSNSKPQK